jgi:photosystem II stability/assembly factor-like uncharacterized protein
MKLKYIYLLGLLVILSCNKYDGPSHETTKSYYFSKDGDAQKTLAGTYFPDSVKIHVSGSEYGIAAQNITAKFSIESGGGSVDASNVAIVNGIASTKWKSGAENCVQRLRADIYNIKNEYISSTYFNACAFRKGVWDSVKIGPDIQIADVLADTIAKKTWMITNTGLYVPDDIYFNWKQIYFQQVNPFSIHGDKKGYIYFSTWNGQIFKSTDSGTSWNTCSSPIPGHPYYYYMTVSNDGYLWTSTPQYNRSLRCSRDGGNTWSADTVGLLTSDLVGDIFRLSNGDILYHSSSNLKLYKSTDDGKSWKNMPCPVYSTKLFVTQKDEIIIYNQDFGITIYKSTDLGKTFKKVYNAWPEYRTTAMSKIIVKKDNYYYCLIAGFGIVRTTDFENFETFWLNKSIVYLYLTYDGVLITKGLTNNVVYYYSD